MVNGLVDFIAGARHFRFEQGYARMKFVNREGIKILLCKGRERIVDPFGNKVVHIHINEC